MLATLGVRRNTSEKDIKKFQKYVREKFSDLIIVSKSITTLQFLGKGVCLECDVLLFFFAYRRLWSCA